MAAKKSTIYLLYYRRMDDQMAYAPEIPEVDPKILASTYEKLTQVVQSYFARQYEFQVQPEYGMFNINPKDETSAKMYRYYHLGELHEDEYDERKIMQRENKGMMVVFRGPDGSKKYVPIESDSYVSEVKKEFDKGVYVKK